MQTDNRLKDNGGQGLETQSPSTIPKATPEQIAEIIKAKQLEKIKKNQERSIQQLLDETFKGWARWL